MNRIVNITQSSSRNRKELKLFEVIQDEFAICEIRKELRAKVYKTSSCLKHDVPRDRKIHWDKKDNDINMNYRCTHSFWLYIEEEVFAVSLLNSLRVNIKPSEDV